MNEANGKAGCIEAVGRSAYLILVHGRMDGIASWRGCECRRGRSWEKKEAVGTEGRFGHRKRFAALSKRKLALTSVE